MLKFYHGPGGVSGSRSTLSEQAAIPVSALNARLAHNRDKRQNRHFA